MRSDRKPSGAVAVARALASHANSSAAVRGIFSVKRLVTPPPSRLVTVDVELIEASIDVNQLKLANAVGIPLPHGRITQAEGHAISDILNKRA